MKKIKIKEQAKSSTAALCVILMMMFAALAGSWVGNHAGPKQYELQYKQDSGFRFRGWDWDYYHAPTKEAADLLIAEQKRNHNTKGWQKWNGNLKVETPRQ